MDIFFNNNSAKKVDNFNAMQGPSSPERGDAPAVSQGAEDSDSVLKDAIQSTPALTESSRSKVKELFKQLEEKDYQTQEAIIDDFLKAIANSSEKDAICLLILSNTEINKDIRNRVIKEIQNLDIRDQVYVSIIKDTDLSSDEAADLAQLIKHDISRDKALDCILESYDMELEKRMEIIKLITNDNKRDEYYASIVQNQFLPQDVWNLKVDALSLMQNDNWVDELLSKISFDDRLYRCHRFYEFLMERNQKDLVMQSMNVSLAGLEKDKKINVVLIQKLAAAEALSMKTLEEEAIQSAMAPIVEDTDIAMDDRLLVFEMYIFDKQEIKRLAHCLLAAFASGKVNHLYPSFYETLSNSEIHHQAVLEIMEASLEGLDAVTQAAVAKEKIIAARVCLQSHTHNQKIEKAILPMIHHSLIQLKDLNVGEELFAVLKILQNPDAIGELGRMLIQDTNVNHRTDLYSFLMDHNHQDLVIEAMNIPLEGLAPDAKNAVVKQKIATAEALYANNLEAATIQKTMGSIVRDADVDINQRLFVYSQFSLFTFSPEETKELASFLMKDTVLEASPQCYLYWV